MQPERAGGRYAQPIPLNSSALIFFYRKTLCGHFDDVFDAERIWQATIATPYGSEYRGCESMDSLIHYIDYDH